MSAKTASTGKRRRALALLLVMAALVAWLQYSKTPHVDAVVCGRDVPAAAADVVMLSASWCGYCRRARGFLVERAVNYCEYDIEQSQRGAELYARSRLGVIPVIFVGDDVVVGFNRDELAQVLVAQDLLSLDEY